ncbi:MAG: radical SAM protein [Nitrospirae bacterium]|nr:radical SAM protein [Nitrospirota bacterium]
MEWLRKYLEKIRLKGRPFIAFQIEPTSRCQLKCTICSRTVFSNEWVNGDMPLSVYKKISKYFHLVDDIHLQGWGEPLLHPNLFDMIQIAKAANCKTSLTTNGVLLTPNISEKLVRQGMDIIAISISGATKETHEGIRHGSHFEQFLDNIKTLSNLKAKMGSKTPKLILSFLMTKTNIKELPEAVSLAKDSGINEFVATNLDYVATQAQDDLKVFSCNKADFDFKNYIETARKRADKLKISFRVYPLELEEVVMCEMNPLQIVFISFDGCVSPCVYLNMTKRGSLPRIFCGQQYELQRSFFGNIAKKDLMEIWESNAYKNFRKAYHNRLNLIRKAYSDIEFGMGAFNKIKDIEKSMESTLSENPLPEVCRTCYKAYNI